MKLLREVELAGPEHLDPGYVAGYDRKADFDPVEDLVGTEALAFREYHWIDVR